MKRAAVATKPGGIPGLGPVEWRAGEHSRIVVPTRATRVATADSDRVVHFIGSTQRVDRYRTKLVGWILKEYRKNPMFLWQHMSWDAPLGRAIRVGMNEEGELAFDIEFVPGDLIPFADTALRLVLEKWMRACSVGFQPNKVERIEEGEDAGVYILKENDLLELSLVSVPANPDALVKLTATVPEPHRGLLVANQRVAEVDGLTIVQARKRFTEWAHDAPIPELDDRPTADADGDELCSLVAWTKESGEEKGKRYVVLAAGEFGAGPGDDDDDEEEGGSEPEPVPAQLATAAIEAMDSATRGGVFAIAFARAARKAGIPVEDLERLDPTLGVSGCAAGFDALFAGLRTSILTKLVAELEELAGADDDEARAGAVLNRANKTRLRNIKTLAQEVLDSAGDSDEEDAASVTTIREGADGKAEGDDDEAPADVTPAVTPTETPAVGDPSPTEAEAIPAGDPPPNEGDRVEAALARMERTFSDTVTKKLAGIEDRVAGVVERLSAFEAKHLGRALVQGRRQTIYDKIISAGNRLDAAASGGERKSAPTPAVGQGRNKPKARAGAR